MFFHENAGNIGLRLDYFQMLYHEASADILAVAYRGYSDSTGKPNEEGLKLDAEAVMKFVRSDLAEHYSNRGGVFVIGRSLGGAVAAHAVSSLPDRGTKFIDGLVLENTFTSIDAMADAMFSYIAKLKWLVLTNHWRTIDLVSKIELPIFYVTCSHDEIVPSHMTHSLYEASTAAQFKQIWVNPDGSHNDTWAVGKQTYLSNLRAFMGRAKKENAKLRSSHDEATLEGEERAHRADKSHEATNKSGKDNLNQYDSEL